MNIKCFNLGYMMTNSFLTWSEDKTAYLFDCGGENLEQIFKYVEDNNLNMKYLILTHGHGDHIQGIKKFMNKFKDAKIYIGFEEKEFLSNPNLSLSENIFGEKFIYDGEINTVKEGDKIGEFEVIDTPGHTVGSKCFYCRNSNILISGDTMFKNSFGRYDLPTGDMYALFKSLKKLTTLPEESIVYSGHTEPTNIKNEKIFLKNIGIL